MTVPFARIPSNVRVPLFYAEVDNSMANSGSLNQRALIVGQTLASGTAAAGVPIIVSGYTQAKTFFGKGSIAALMVNAFRQNDNFTELWVLPLADDGSAVAATGTITFTGPSTAAGVVSLYVAGVLVSVKITSGLTATAVATAVAAAINANTDLPCLAAPSTGVVTITAVNAGPLGNDIDLRINYMGAPAGEALPAGLTCVIVAMASGATPPAMTTPFANLGDSPFDFIAFPYNDTTSLNALKSLLDDVTGRWSWTRQVYGHGFTAYRGTLAARVTFGTARNDQHVSALGYPDSPSPVWAWAAAFAGASAPSLEADPGRPLHTLPIAGVLPGTLANRDMLVDENTQLFDGMSTITVDLDGTIRLQRVVTTYQLNAFSQPDNSYLSINTLFLLAYVLRSLKTRVTSKYARVKLANDGTRFGPGAAIVTPNTVRVDLIAAYRELESQGYVQDGDSFKKALIVERNATDVNRLDVLWPGTLINQLEIFALLAQFRL